MSPEEHAQLLEAGERLQRSASEARDTCQELFMRITKANEETGIRLTRLSFLPGFEEKMKLAGITEAYVREFTKAIRRCKSIIDQLINTDTQNEEDRKRAEGQGQG